MPTALDAVDQFVYVGGWHARAQSGVSMPPVGSIHNGPTGPLDGSFALVTTLFDADLVSQRADEA